MSCTLIHGDCLVEMDKLIDEGVKVDLVLTDPPYGTTASEWDNQLDFKEIYNYINKLSHKTTTTLLFGSEPFSTQIRSLNMTDFKYTLYWIKNHSTGFVHAKNKPLKNLELIDVFSKGTTVHANQSKDRMTYNPQGLVKINKSVKAGANKFGTMNGKRPSHVDEYVQEYTNYPTMTLEYDVVPTNATVHPTQKPVALLEYLIKTYTNENDVVLDFTMGSGSTGVACLQTNRNFIGIELDENYYNIAKERCSEYQSKLW